MSSLVVFSDDDEDARAEYDDAESEMMVVIAPNVSLISRTHALRPNLHSNAACIHLLSAQGRYASMERALSEFRIATENNAQSEFLSCLEIVSIVL